MQKGIKMDRIESAPRFRAEEIDIPYLRMSLYCLEESRDGRSLKLALILPTLCVVFFKSEGGG